MATARLASRLALAAAGLHLAAGELVFVGSAGCDWDDKGCSNDVESQRVLTAVEVGTQGELTVRQQLSVKQEGLPAWLVTSRDGACLFATRPETDDVLSYRLGGSGDLSSPSRVSSGGPTPVHASLSRDGRFLLVANYDGSGTAGATLASFAVGTDCSLTAVDTARHSGKSTHPWRQTAAHIHSVTVSRSGLIYACDLGADEIVTYAISADGKLTEWQRTKAASGAGPRHMAEHPTLPVVYVVNELSQTVVAYAVERDGTLRQLQEHSLVRDGAADWGSKAAAIAVTPDGSALFATNRGGRNTVTAFSVDAAGALAFAEEVTAPAFPRGVTLAHGGAVLLVGGQSRTELVSFLVKGSHLTSTGHTLSKADGLPANPAAFVAIEDVPLVLP